MCIKYGACVEANRLLRKPNNGDYQMANARNTNDFALALGQALIAATFETTIAKAKTFQVRLEDFPIEAAVALMQYGVGRKFNDAVGGADKTAEVKVELAEGMIADWKAGKIGRQPTASISDEVKMRRNVIRELFNASATDEQRTAFKATEAAEQTAKLDAIFDKQTEAKQAAILAVVAERIEAQRAKQAQAKELAGGLAI